MRTAAAAAFRVGHAAHADWRAALTAAAAQLQAGAGADETAPATLGHVYWSDHYAGHEAAILAELQSRWPAVAWVGCVGVGIAADGVEYFDEPALALMLAALPAAQFEVWSGASRLQRIQPHAALVHADPATPDLAELVAEMSERTSARYLFGGLASSRRDAVHIAGGVLRGGLSGVAYAREVGLISRVTQGCQPVGPVREVTACQRNVAVELDGEPALACLLRDLDLPAVDEPRSALPRLRATLAGLTDAGDATLARGGQFGTDTRVRHLVGIDPQRQAVAVADLLHSGMRLAFCQRDVAAARRDLVRICSEIRDEIDSTGVVALGAVYVSCNGRGGPHFGAPSGELKILQHALGDLPLVGFFAAGEIAHRHLYGYTGVLTVFTAPAAQGGQP